MNQSNQKQVSYIGEIKANTRPWETLHATLTSIEEENQVQADLRVLGETFPIVAEKTGSAKNQQILIKWLHIYEHESKLLTPTNQGCIV